MYFVLVCKVTNSDLDSHKSVSLQYFHIMHIIIIIYVYSQNTVVIFFKTFISTLIQPGQ